jgi:hypothetical protein
VVNMFLMIARKPLSTCCSPTVRTALFTPPWGCARCRFRPSC